MVYDILLEIGDRNMATKQEIEFAIVLQELKTQMEVFKLRPNHLVVYDYITDAIFALEKKAGVDCPALRDANRPPLTNIEQVYDHITETVASKFGDVTITVCDDEILYFDANSGDKFLVVNCVELNVAAHLVRKPDGWQVQNFYIRRRMDLKHSSHSADEKIKAEFARMAEIWTLHHPDAMHEARRLQINNTLADLQEKVREKQEELQDLYTQWNEWYEKEQKIREEDLTATV